MVNLIYVGDEVIESSRWAGGAENPNKGRTGKVSRISHGIQSLFSRGYIILSMWGDKGYFESWQYTLDVTKINPLKTDLIKSGNIMYLDDLVEVVDEEHKHFRKTGFIKEIYEGKNTLMYGIRDQAYVDDMNEAQKEWADILNSEVQKKLDEPHNLDNFLVDIKKKLKIESSDPKVDDLLIEQFDLKEVYPMIVRQIVVDKMETLPGYAEYAKAVEAYRLDSVFSAELDSIKLIDRFPSNKNFTL